jgi:hypothetical protein
MTSRELEKENFVSQIADYLYAHGLGSAALVGLEVGRPLAFLGGQLLWMLQPAMGLLFPKDSISKIAVVLEDPQAVNQLIGQLADRK